jgi:putative transposase
MGGHKPEAISGEHADFLAGRVREGAFTLRGLAAELAKRGLKGGALADPPLKCL